MIDKDNISNKYNSQLLTVHNNNMCGIIHGMEYNNTL